MSRKAASHPLVSSGPAPVNVPDVTGQTLEAAEATLTNAEFTVGTSPNRFRARRPPAL